MDAQDDVGSGLRAAMRRMPAAVAIVATRDPDDGQAAGLAASAVIPVSMDPPSMLISINRSSRAHGAIERAGRFSINLLSTGQTDLVRVFSSPDRRHERFVAGDWRTHDGLPYLGDAPAAILCSVRETLLFGTHELFVGAVDALFRAEAGVDPLGWLEGDFAQLGRITLDS